LFPEVVLRDLNLQRAAFEKGRKAFRRCCGSVDGDIDGYLALRAEKTTEKMTQYF
jgi:hypothetical protein